jgi:serine/threonine protein kinase
MSGSSVHLTRAGISELTHLGRICGSKELFCDRYEILRILGRGGFGVTFLAKDAVLPGQPLCVIKQLFPSVNHPAALQLARRRFEQEAKTLSKLGSHANVPTLLNYFEVDDEFYLVQEYVRGTTLSAEVKQFGPFSERAVKQILLDFLPILDYVHANHVIHRDIKPPNLIRCRDDGRLVLIDFGAVKDRMLNIPNNSMQSMATQFVGTVGFAPPEQSNSRPVYASDIFALGVTCLYLLSGRTPLSFDYDPKTREINWQEHVTVSSHFGSILARMTKLSVRHRYQSAQEILRAMELEPYLDNLQDCMNSRPRQIAQRSGDSTGDSLGLGTPVTARKAMAQRIWDAQSKSRRVGGHLQLCPSLGLS